MKVEKLFEMEGASQEFNESPQVVNNGKSIILKYDKETENGKYTWTGITFKDAIACKITKIVCIEMYMIEAYDTVCVIKDSKWANKVKNAYKGDNIFSYKHYIIYFEDYGCYEFIAKEAYKGIENLSKTKGVI